jgi:hypothetical protein
MARQQRVVSARDASVTKHKRPELTSCFVRSMLFAILKWRAIVNQSGKRNGSIACNIFPWTPQADHRGPGAN